MILDVEERFVRYRTFLPALVLLVPIVSVAYATAAVLVGLVQPAVLRAQANPKACI